MMAGRSVTTRIKWVTRFSDQGRFRWTHRTPVLANKGGVGVSLVVVVDEEEEEEEEEEHLVRWKANWPIN